MNLKSCFFLICKVKLLKNMSAEEYDVVRNDIFNILINTGCCKRCSLRFLGNVARYDGPEDVNNLKNQIISNNQNGSDENTLKKLKMNPCIICLDLLQDVTLQNMILNKELDKVIQYDCDTFVNYISFPIAVLIREHSMEIFMKGRFPEFFKDYQIMPINRAWSLSVQNKLSNRLKKRFDRNSNLNIQFTTTYELDKEELSVLSDVEDSIKKLNGKDNTLSRTAINEFLKTMNSDNFQKHVSVPPQIPGKAVALDKITYKHEPIFIAGRYCKYSRNLGQTPWIVDSVRIVENSVQEIIFQSLENLFQCKNLVFSSSGREDFDVRTLGRGRPFFIKICDPKVTKISFENFRAIEDEIKKTNLIKVQDLQFINKKCLNNIKEGEQFKQKTYRALCIIDKLENLEVYLSKINNLSNVTLQQKTPIRVYHRRSTDVRERVIYEIKARSIPGKNNLFVLDMVTQAGTYVKEFVHGDLGRTKPCLSEIIGGRVDIVALDVLDIHLDFPPCIISGTESEN